MARKSRKDVNSTNIPTITSPTYRVGGYVRLSAEDKKVKGDSIETQQAIIKAFIAEHPDLELTEIYIDNGLSGQSFQRPAFNRMIEDMEHGKINCCISKDLSRLGRNAIDTGYYIEKYFPTKGMPREHMQLAKIKTTKGKSGEDKPFTPTCNWKAQNVRNVLSNIQYTGAYVSGKILTDADTGKSYRPSKDEWIIIPDKNPAIISKDLFDEVQAVIAEGKKSRQKNKKPRQFLLRGKVRCGCCDMAMWYDPISNPVFRCHQTLADPSATCHKLKVVAAELDEAVLDVVRKQAEVILNTSDIPP